LGDLQDPGDLRPDLGTAALDRGLDINAAQLACFLAFWRQHGRHLPGIDSIRFLLNIKAPILLTLGLALLAWAYHEAHGFGPMLAQPSHSSREVLSRPVLGVLLPL